MVLGPYGLRSHAYRSRKHGSVVHKGPIPFPKIILGKCTFNITFQFFIGYIFSSSEEKMDENPANICLNKNRGLVTSKRRDRSRCALADARQGFQCFAILRQPPVKFF